MNNQTPRTFALKVKISYSDKNIQKLKERFLRFEGVDEVDVEAQHELVIITGTVDPRMLINYLESKNINAEVYTNNDSDCESVSLKNAKPEKSKKCSKEKKSRKPKEEDHVCEPYEAQKIDPLICRDPYCKNHKSRPTINSKVPSINSEDHPRHNMQGHGHEHEFSFGNQLPMYGRGPSLYGIGQIPMMQPSMLPPFSSFGFPPMRNHMPRFGNFRRDSFM